MKTSTTSFIKGKLILSLLVIFGCQKDSPIDESSYSDLNIVRSFSDSISVTKDAFLKNELLDIQLYENFSDTSKIKWDPIWEKATIKKINDSIAYIYIELSAQLVNSNTDSFISEVTIYDFRKFLIAKYNEAEIDFKLATYLSEKGNVTGKKSSAELGVSLKNFKGLLLLEDIESGDKNTYRYVKGFTKENVGSRNDDLSRQSEYSCVYRYVCNWGTSCSGRVIVTATWGEYSSTPRYECSYPYNGYGCPNQTWYRTGSYMEQSCTFGDGDPPPPPPGNDDPPGGGGGNNAPSHSQLMGAISNRPFGLILPHIPCDVVRRWIALADFEVSSTLKQKVNSLVVDIPIPNTSGVPTSVSYVADVLDINDAFSAIVNMDYFSVKVTSLPIINGQRVSPQKFLNQIRTNINSFVDIQKSEFSPYNYYGHDDRALWNSSNPLGAIVSIDIPGNDGSVVTSRYASNGWVFSTIKDPWNGLHPVSGNREFGYLINSDGSYTFYTRGVDRITDPFTTIMNDWTGIAFDGADALWESFQKKLKDFINSHQGSAVINAPVKYRPSWSLVKEVMDGNKPLSTLSNDCD